MAGDEDARWQPQGGGIPALDDHVDSRAATGPAALRDHVRQRANDRSPHDLLERLGLALLDITGQHGVVVSCHDRTGAITDSLSLGTARLTRQQAGDILPWLMQVEGTGRDSAWAVLRPDCPFLTRRPGHGRFCATGLVPLDRVRSFAFMIGWWQAPPPAPFAQSLLRSAKAFVLAGAQAQAANRFGDHCLEALMLGMPAFCIDREMSLRACNSLGRAELGGNGPLRLADGRLVAREAAADALLARSVQRLLRNEGTQAATAALALQPALPFRRMALLSRCAMLDEPSFVLMTLPVWDHAQAARHLGDLFGLGGTDRKLIEGITAALPAAAIAAATGLTEMTVRTYTKRLMARLNLRRQTDLFRLAEMAVPLAADPDSNST